MMITAAQFSVILAACSLLFAIFSGMINMRRNETSDTKKDASEHTTVIVKLETIAEGISDIKNEMRNMQADYKELRETVIRVDESAKQGHKRLDKLECRIEALEHGVNNTDA